MGTDKDGLARSAINTLTQTSAFDLLPPQSIINIIIISFCKADTSSIMTGEKRKADMAMSVTDELSKTYEAGGPGEVRQTEEVGAAAKEGYGYGYGYGHGFRHGNCSGDEEVARDERRIRQAERLLDEGKGMIDNTLV